MLRQWKKLQSHSLEWQKCFEHIKTYAVSPSSILKDYYSRLHLKMERTQQILYTTITSHVTPLDQKKEKRKNRNKCMQMEMYHLFSLLWLWFWRSVTVASRCWVQLQHERCSHNLIKLMHVTGGGESESSPDRKRPMVIHDVSHITVQTPLNKCMCEGVVRRSVFLIW